MPEKSGVVESLESDNLRISDVILRADIPKLSLVSAGKQHEYVTELLVSQRMIELANELGARYQDRIIIFDGPPILSTPQTQVLTGLVGQVVFVIEMGKTPQTVVEEALSLIAGGGYFRLYPYLLTHAGLRQVNSRQQPFIFYLHPWEIDPDQPRVEAGWFSRFRHYNNLDKCESRLQQLMKDFQFDTAWQVLNSHGLAESS